MASFSTAAATRRWIIVIGIGQRMISVLLCAIPSLGGGWSCPLHRRRRKTDLAVPQVWLLIRWSPSHFYVLQFEQIFEGSYIASVNIYSSRTGAWTRRDSGMVEKVILCSFIKYVFVCDIMYTVGSLNDKHEYVLLGVDMEGKVWKTIRVPNGPGIGAIGLLQGCLHYSVDSVVSIDDNNESLVSEITLWCLKDRDSKELVLKHTINTNKLVSMTGKNYSVVEIHPHCDTIFLVSCGGDTLVAYDMRHQKVGCILNLEKDSIQKFLPYVPLFQKSLAEVDEQ
uniref:F-box protein At3g26010-like beta-propeller domain-containing protein n=1 Tax=Aegilops tauschii subsp. strangulata TaxID=200361 RepID=A0A453QD14_AEGTS